MLQSFHVNDQVLNQKLFIADEVQYNLIHRICEAKSAKCLKATDGTMVFAQSEGQNAWLWMSKELSDDDKYSRLQELLEILKGTQLPGVTGVPMIAELFAQVYAEANGLQYFFHMAMESYTCIKLKKPINANGTMLRATSEHVGTVAEFLAGFSEGAYGVIVDPASQIPAAEGIIETGNIFLWFVENQPVSMANIAHRSPRHARINAVYTPPLFRKKGYASAIVAGLCSLVEAERLAPMLYADLKNPESNKVYRNIGFEERGTVADIKFK